MTTPTRPRRLRSDGQVQPVHYKPPRTPEEKAEAAELARLAHAHLTRHNATDLAPMVLGTENPA